MHQGCTEPISQLQKDSQITHPPALHLQGFFQGFFRAQKLNLEFSFETKSSHQKILCSKMRLFELNSWCVQISFQMKTRKLSKKWLEFISQHKKNNAFTVFNQFIVSLSAPALTHGISTTLKWVQVGGGDSRLKTPSCSAKLNLLCKNGPKSWKKPWFGILRNGTTRFNNESPWI